MAEVPMFTTTPKIGIANINTANGNRDGTGSITSVFASSSTKATRLEYITIAATGVTTAGMIRLFIHDGSVSRLLGEVKVTAVPTPSATEPTFKATWVPFGICVLPVNYSIRASTHNAESFNLIGFGGEF